MSASAGAASPSSASGSNESHLDRARGAADLPVCAACGACGAGVVDVTCGVGAELPEAAWSWFHRTPGCALCSTTSILVDSSLYDDVAGSTEENNGSRCRANFRAGRGGRCDREGSRRNVDRGLVGERRLDEHRHGDGSIGLVKVEARRGCVRSSSGRGARCCHVWMLLVARGPRGQDAGGDGGQRAPAVEVAAGESARNARLPKAGLLWEKIKH